MKKLVLSIGCLFASAITQAAPLFNSNVGVISFAKSLDEGKITLSVDTNDIDTLQTFEIAEITLVLGENEKAKSEIYLSKENTVSVKIKNEVIAIGSLDEQKNLELARGLLPEYDIVKESYVLKLRFPVEDKTKN